MRARYIAIVPVLLVIAALSLPGCGPSESVSAQGDFAPGAFPPVLSDMDYHKNAWTRTDCMTCHEAGVQEAPKLRHVSLPDLAKHAKCRTCHVLVPGQEPAN
jgi:hypothetical protein